MKQELVNLVARHDRTGCDQSLLFRLGAEARGVETTAIVLDGHQNLRARMKRLQPDSPLLRLARRGPGRRILNAMVDWVADQVHERISKSFDHGLVEFGILARRHEFDRLCELRGQVWSP